MLVKGLYELKIKGNMAHRDVKPANIILSSDGKSFLWTDFGCSILV